ncbi:hypothetical protein [Nocardia brasiliensis]|uniref:hypothetical protein n=1 Tax=Nocardia brasiliensis TaxID=37326 RepID=UPI00245541A6|nr:hypothetical protein [Nocardia brasiliensis]
MANLAEQVDAERRDYRDAAHDQLLDPVPRITDLAEIQTAAMINPPRVAVYEVESPSSVPGSWLPGTAVLTLGDVNAAEEVWGYVADSVSDWAELPACVSGAMELYQVASRLHRDVGVVTVLAHDPSGRLDAANRDRAEGELVRQLQAAGTMNSAGPPKIHLLGIGAGAEVVRSAAARLGPVFGSLFVKDLGALPFVPAVVLRGHAEATGAVGRIGEVDALLHRYSEREQQLYEAGLDHVRALAAVDGLVATSALPREVMEETLTRWRADPVGLSEQQSALVAAVEEYTRAGSEYDRRQVEFAVASSELRRYTTEGIIQYRPLPAAWHPELCQTTEEVVDGLRRARGVELRFTGIDLDPSIARDLAAAVYDHGAPAYLDSLAIVGRWSGDDYGHAEMPRLIGDPRPSIIHLNQQYIVDPDRALAAWRALVDANPRLEVPQRHHYCLLLRELGHVLVQAGRFRAEKHASSLLRELWAHTRVDAQPFADWIRPQLNDRAFHRDGELDIRSALAESYFAGRIDRANASLVERELHDLVQRTARVWTAQYHHRTRPASAAERAQTLVNIALGATLTRGQDVRLADFEVPGLDSDAVCEFVTTIRTTLAEHPQIDIVAVDFAPMEDDMHGETYSHRQPDRPQGVSLSLNERMGLSPELSRSDARRLLAAEFYRGDPDRPIATTALHELGHGFIHVGHRAGVISVESILDPHFSETRGSGTGYAAWLDQQFSGRGYRIVGPGERVVHEAEAPAEAFVQVKTYQGSSRGEAAEPTEGEWVLYRHIVAAAEHTAQQFGTPARQPSTAATDPEMVGPAAERAREQLARQVTEQRLALVEAIGDATGPSRAAARQQLASVDTLAAARLRAALALAAAVGAAEQDWAHALDILDRELVTQLRARGGGDTGGSDPDTGNCAVSALLALRDLFPDSDIRLLDSAREPAGVHLGEIVAAAGGAMEDLGRAELRDQLLDSSDPAVAALVLTQWKFPDDKGSQGHVELVVNYRASRVSDEDGVVLSVDESRVRAFSTVAPGEVFQHLAILFDEKGKPLRPLDTREREQYRSQLLVPFGRSPDRDPAETLAALRARVRRSVAVGQAAGLGAHEHQIDVLEQALRGVAALRDHIAKRLIARAGVAPVPGLWHNELDLGELERRERNGRARLAELLPPGSLAEHLQALPHDQQRYSPEVNELYRYYLSVDSTLSLAEAYLECRNRLADSERAVNELATAADDLQRQADLIARMDRELAQRTSESRDPTPVAAQRDRLLAKHRRAFEHLLTSLRTVTGVVADRAPLTAAVADLRAAARDEFRSLRSELEGILAERNYGRHVDEALSADSGMRRELVRERELAQSRLSAELARAGRTEFLPNDLVDTEMAAHIAEIVDRLTADGHNSMLLVTLAMLENALGKIQVVERADRARSIIDTIDELERALTAARADFMGALGRPRPLPDELADTYLRLMGLARRLDRRAVAAREAAEQQAVPGLDPAWIERVSAKYRLPQQESPLDRDAERRLLDKLLRTGAWLIAIIGKDPADLTDEQIRLAQLWREPLGAVPPPGIRPEVLESPTGLEWSGIADNDADWRQFKAALVHEYVELRQYVAWRRAVHRRRFGLAELNVVVHDTVADVARELDGVRRTLTIDGAYQAREERLGAPLLGLREQVASMAADAAKTFSSIGTRTGVESITQLWPGSAALREVEQWHAEVRADIADQMLVDVDQVTPAWAGDQLTGTVLHEQRTLMRQLETFRDLAAMLGFAEDFHRAEIWIRAIDAVDTGLVQGRLWQEHAARHGVPGGWGYRLAGLTELVRNLNELAQRREALADPPRTPMERRWLAESAVAYGVTLQALIDDPSHHREPLQRWRAVKSRQLIEQLAGLEPEYRVGADGEWTESRVQDEVSRLDRLAQLQPSPEIESALRHAHEILAIDDLLAFAAERSAQLAEMDELDRTLDTLFEKAAGWGVAVQRAYVVLNPPLTCLLTMFEVAAHGNGPRPRFRVPEEELDTISLHGVDGADAALWAGANWRRFRDVSAAFEWVRASAGSATTIGLRRTVVLAVDYQPIDQAVGANALVIKIDDSGRVVAAETEQQLDDDGNPVIGVRYIEGEVAVRVWATMMSTDAGAAAVHALAFQGDTPVDPLFGREPDNVRSRQIPHGSIHGPPSRPDISPAADTPAVQVLHFRGLKKLTGVDLGVAVAVRTDEQQPGVVTGPRGTSDTADLPDPACAAVLAQRPHPVAILLSGDPATIAERARVIRAYVDDRGVQRERLVLVAVPERGRRGPAQRRGGGPRGVGWGRGPGWVLGGFCIGGCWGTGGGCCCPIWFSCRRGFFCCLSRPGLG